MQLFHKRLSSQRNQLIPHFQPTPRLNKYANNNHNLSPLRYREPQNQNVRQNRFQFQQLRPSRDKQDARRFRPDSKMIQEPHYIKKALNKKVLCATHTEKEAEYCYIADDETFFYCCLCAAKLASQGFEMQRVSQCASLRINRYSSEQNIIKKKDFFPCQKKTPKNQENNNFPAGKHQTKQNLSNSPNSTLTSRRSKIKCSKHSSNELIQQLNTLSLSIDDLLVKYSEIITAQHFQHNHELSREKELIIKFYEKIMEIIMSYKEKHLQKLEEQSGLLEKEKEKIKQNLKDLSIMKQDMNETDFDEVIEKVSKEDFKACLDFYLTKYSDFMKEYSQLSDRVREITFQNHHLKEHAGHHVSQIQENIDKIQNLIKNFYNPAPTSQNPSKSIQNLIKQYQKSQKPKLKIKNPFSNENKNYQNSPNP